MKQLILFLTLILLAFSATAQSKYNNQTATTSPASGRYEIITSSIALRETYLLDKETGDTWILYEDNDTGRVFWGTIANPESFPVLGIGGGGKAVPRRWAVSLPS